MNAPLYREVLLPADSSQPPLPLATEGVLRYVWESRFGTMLIEVVGDQVYVNGGLVERHRGADVPPAPGEGPAHVGSSGAVGS
jgi:hypothetical protein